MRKTELAYAKLNLSLDVVGLLEGGYHALESVMQSVNLTDTAEISVEKGDGSIRVTSNWSYLPTGEKNLAGKAAAVFLRETEITGYDVTIQLTKHIPACAGMGGGSSDGAAVLRGLDSLFGTKLGWRNLSAMGAKVGSDVPFCVLGGTSFCEGRGELLTPLKALPHAWVTLCKPRLNVSTPEMFRVIDGMKMRCRPDTPGLLDAIAHGNLGGAARRMYNVFEEAMPVGGEDIAFIKEMMIDAGALGAVMTGSGPTVLGVFDGKAAAERAANALRGKFSDTFLTETAANSPTAD